MVRSPWLLWVFTWRNYTVTLTFPIGNITTMTNHDMTSLSRSIWAHYPLNRDNGCCIGFLGLERI
uniref:Uncharacterized protein n=1 Tax=Rhizophora mucronata TaxID=61149 RepID=A0A2P2N647_RHIMU